MISLRLYTLALVAIGVCLAAFALLRRRKKAPDVELERRTWLDGGCEVVWRQIGVTNPSITSEQKVRQREGA